MEDFFTQYHYWLDKLGWASAEMLCLLTRGVSRSALPGGRDRLLEKFLSGGVINGELWREKIGGQRIYGKARKGGRGNVCHDFMAAQAVVKLWLALGQFSKTIYSPGEFFSESLPVIPDFGLTVNFPNGLHGFSLEYQSYDQAGRTTKPKLLEYWKNFGRVKEILGSDFLWVIFVLARDEHWVGELAASLAFNFVFLISATTFFRTEAIETEPVFFTEAGRKVSLIERK